MSKYIYNGMFTRKDSNIVDTIYLYRINNLKRVVQYKPTLREEFEFRHPFRVSSIIENKIYEQLKVEI